LREETVQRGQWGKKLDGELEVLRKNITEQNSLLANKDRIVGDLTIENEKLGHWGQSLDAEVNALRAVCAKLREETVQRGQWGKKLDGEIEGLRNNIATRNSLLAEKEQRINELLGSKSWRWTYPFRLASRLAGKIIHPGRKAGC